MNLIVAWVMFVVIWCAVAAVIVAGLVALVRGYDQHRQRSAMWARLAGKGDR